MARFNLRNQLPGASHLDIAAGQGPASDAFEMTLSMPAGASVEQLFCQTAGGDSDEDGDEWEDVDAATPKGSQVSKLSPLSLQ